MAHKCYICKYYHPKRMSLFRIPNRTDEYSDRPGLWLKILGAKKENVEKIRVCSDHFIKKKPCKEDNYLDADWVPNKNLREYSKNFKQVEYYYRTKKSKRSLQDEIQKQQARIVENYHNNVGCGYDGGSHQEASIVSKTGIVLLFEEGSSSPGSHSLSAEGAIIDKSIGISPSPDAMMAKSIDISPNSLKKRKIEVEQKLFTMNIQTDLTSEDIDFLFKHYQEVVEERDNLLLKISTLIIDVEFFKNNDKVTRFYTGLPSWKVLNHLFHLVERYLPEHGNCKLSPFQMLVLTLIKLRLNLKFTDLAYRFQVQVATVSQYFHRCLCILYKLFHGSKLIHWPRRQNFLSNTPSYFRCCFKETITVIVDCFEIFIEKCASLLALAQSFSKYKHHVTIKFLIGISTTGAIIFVSKGFGGRCSDKEIVLKSKFFDDNIKEGDVILSDKGFLIKEEVAAKKATIKMPCFVRNKNQLDPVDVEESRNLSSVRIHVERVICEVREKYNICVDVALMSLVSKQNELFVNDAYDKIIFVCCCLVNMCPTMVKNPFEM